MPRRDAPHSRGVSHYWRGVRRVCDMVDNAWNGDNVEATGVAGLRNRVRGSHWGSNTLACRNSLHKTALHASVAATLGAFGLAVAANVYGWLFASGNQRALAIALVACPLLTGVPAFLVAMVAAVVLDRLSSSLRG